MNVKINYWRLLPLVLLFLFFGSAVRVSAEEIKDFNTIIKINNDSSIDVVEKIDYDFGDLSRHGIYRDITYKYKARGGNFQLLLSDFTVKDSLGNDYDYKVSNHLGSKRIKIGDADKYVTGEKNYIISYKVKRAINYFSDHDELYWNATGNEWDVPIDKARAVVVFPDNILKDSVNFDCFEGVTGSIKKCFSSKLETAPNGNISNVVFLSNFLDSKNGLTFVVSLPKGVITEPTIFEKLLRIIGDNIILFLPFFVFVFLYNNWRKKGRDPVGRGTIVAQFDAPDGLSPAEVGVIQDEKVNKKDVSSLIITLAVKGYIKIRKIKDKATIFKKDDYIFEKLEGVNESFLASHERKMLHALFSSKNIKKSIKDIKIVLKKFNEKDRDSLAYKLFSKLAPYTESKQNKDENGNKNIVKLSSLQNEFVSSYSNIEKEIYKSLVDKGYFPTNPDKVRRMYIIIGFVVISLTRLFQLVFGPIGIVSGLISGIMIMIFGKFMPVKTVKGVEAREHILGLKKYLEVAEADRLKFHNAPEKNPKHFEKLLPYAIVLGVEKEWAKQFEGLYDQEPSWYSGAGSFNATALVSSLGSFQTSANTIITASSGGSGFSGGSGGGGGGGGGGSW